jgi:hypothetical protein
LDFDEDKENELPNLTFSSRASSTASSLWVSSCLVEKKSAAAKYHFVLCW